MQRSETLEAIKIVALTIIIVCCFMTTGLVCGATNCVDVLMTPIRDKIYPEYVTSPETLGEWMEKEFTYQKDLDNTWKHPHQTVKDKGGDCEDFASLAVFVLKDLGYQAHVIAIKWKTDEGIVGHALAMFKRKDDDTWDFFDNYRYEEVHSVNPYKTVVDAYGHGTWTELIIFNHVGWPLKTIKRGT